MISILTTMNVLTYDTKHNDVCVNRLVTCECGKTYVYNQQEQHTNSSSHYQQLLALSTKKNNKLKNKLQQVTAVYKDLVDKLHMPQRITTIHNISSLSNNINNRIYKMFVVNHHIYYLVCYKERTGYMFVLQSNNAATVTYSVVLVRQNKKLYWIDEQTSVFNGINVKGSLFTLTQLRNRKLIQPDDSIIFGVRIVRQWY